MEENIQNNQPDPNAGFHTLNVDNPDFYERFYLKVFHDKLPLLPLDYKETAESYIQSLPEREQIIVNGRLARNGEKITLEAIGKQIGITRERVRQIELKTYRKAGIKTSREILKYGLAEYNSRLGQQKTAENELEKQANTLIPTIENLDNLSQIQKIYLNLPVKTIGLPHKPDSVLRKYRIETIRQLLSVKPETISKLPYITIEDIIDIKNSIRFAEEKIRSLDQLQQERAHELYLNSSISLLNLSLRTVNMLKKAGIETIGALMASSRHNMANILPTSSVNMAEVQTVLYKIPKEMWPDPKEEPKYIPIIMLYNLTCGAIATLRKEGIDTVKRFTRLHRSNLINMRFPDPYDRTSAMDEQSRLREKYKDADWNSWDALPKVNPRRKSNRMEDPS